MHVSRRWLWVLMVATLIVAAPVYADDTKPTPVTDKGQNVYVVDRSQGALYNTMSDEEVDRIRHLQNDTVWMQLVSPISPDDQAVLMTRGDSIGFLNLEDGSFDALDTDGALSRFLPLPLLGVGGFVWYDDRTLVSAAIDFNALIFDDDGSSSQVLLLIDRLNARVRTIPLHNLPENGIVYSVSPNASRLVILSKPDSAADTSEDVVTAQVTWPTTSALDRFPSTLQAKFSARISKSVLGHRLAQLAPLFSADRSTFTVAAKDMTLTLYNVESGQQQDLQSIKPGAFPSSIDWSQDSARLSVVTTGVISDDEDRSSRASYDGALLSEQVYRDATGNLAPADNPFRQNNVLDVFDLNSGEHHSLRAADGDDTYFDVASWSTDGQTILAHVLHPGKVAGRRYPIYMPLFAEGRSYRFFNFELKEVSRLDAPQLNGPLIVRSSFVSPDEVIFTAINGSNFQPFYYNRVSGELRSLADRDGVYINALPTNHSRQLVFIFSSFTDPEDVYRVNWDGQAFSRITWSNEELRQTSKVEQHPVSFRLANGQTRNGTLILPAGTAFPPKKIPIVVWQEGGPGGAMPNIWDSIVERPFALLPNFGMGLLVVPLSGREGLGTKAYNALADRNNFGQIDIDEQAEIVRQMISRGWTSKGQVGITGCSYGGYFALQSAARYPDTYAAVNAQCSLVDSISEWTRGYPALMPYLQGLPPYNKLEEYRRDSPLYNATSIKAAVLSFDGLQDFLPITLNENLHLQLINNGVKAKMLQFVGSGHGITGNYANDYELFAAQEQISWFKTYLK